jgi:hypothetical protein
MILINGDSFTAGAESQVAWPDLVSDAVSIADSGASNDYILRSTVEYVLNQARPDQVIIAWTTPDRIEISGKHLTATSWARYGAGIVDAVFADWDSAWAQSKFLTQIRLLDDFLSIRDIPHFFVSTFGIQCWAQGIAPAPWLGWPSSGIVEWMGDCAKGPGGHPLVAGHQRIAEHINEHIRHLGWVP